MSSGEVVNCIPRANLVEVVAHVSYARVRHGDAHRFESSPSIRAAPTQRSTDDVDKPQVLLRKLGHESFGVIQVLHDVTELIRIVVDHTGAAKLSDSCC